MKKLLERYSYKISYRIPRNCWTQDIKISDYVVATIISVIFLWIILYTFYHSIIICFIGSPLIIVYIFFWRDKRCKKLKLIFIEELKDYLQALATALRTGYAMENAMKEARNDLKKQYNSNTKIMRDTKKIEHFLSVNTPVDMIWHTWATDSEIEELNQFVVVFMTSKKLGGDSVSIINQTISQLCKKIKIKKEIQVLLAAKKLEFQVMSVIPLGILVYMSVGFGSFMDTLYTGVLGRSVMTISLGIYIIAYWWGSKIIDIKV